MAVQCRQCEPFTAEMHCWSYTKGEHAARVEMKSGEWNKEQFVAEVQSHDGRPLAAGSGRPPTASMHLR